jgi:hypothetical protein
MVFFGSVAEAINYTDSVDFIGQKAVGRECPSGWWTAIRIERCGVDAANPVRRPH